MIGTWDSMSVSVLVPHGWQNGVKEENRKLVSHNILEFEGCWESGLQRPPKKEH